jgi:ATP:ADP antiporter, AAA family
VDLDAARLAVDALQSREKSSTLYAMSLFQMIRKERLSPEMLSILSYREDELKAESMDSLLDVPCHALNKEIEETLADRRIVAEVQGIVAMESYQSIMEKRLSELVGNANASEVERMEAAKLIGILKTTPAVRLCLKRLLQDTSPDVLTYALDSAAVHRLSECVPLIIRLLGNPVTMPPAQDALSCYESGIEEILGAHLNDPNENPDLRNSIPDILARLETQRSADILIQALVCGTEEGKQSVIDALYKIHSNQPRIHIETKKIMASVFVRISRNYDIYLAGYESQLAGCSPGRDLDWKADLDLATKQIFDLLTLIYPSEDIVKAYQNILLGTRKSFDSSLELLDNVLDSDLKLLLFPIIDDLPPEHKARQLRRLRRSLDKRLS